MDYLNLISVPAIATVTYWIIEAIKYACGGNEKFKRLIPIIAGVLGAILGAICFYLLPDIVPATNVIVAIVIGASSGWTSVGFNQVIKQVTKGDDSNGTKSD